MDWSDPRLPSTLRVNGAWYIYGPLPIVPEGEAAETWQDLAVMVVEMNVLLEGAEGSWRGTGRAVEQGSESDPDRRYSTYVLEGEGAYAGMHALLRGAPSHDAHGPWDEAYEGWIIEGEAPALPEAPDAE